MNFKKNSVPYSETGFYSKIVLDYLSKEEQLKNFYEYEPIGENVQKAINKRKKYPVDRKLLSGALLQQYQLLEITEKVKSNIELLKSGTTFTITTAHQPNIFTGPLYFVYKILHAIKLSAYCKEQFPQYNFVPVYYMGSEDADLDELGHIFINGEKLEWKTKQTGAVGRMLVDGDLLELINRIESELKVLPNGAEIIEAVKKYYCKGVSVQLATLGFVNYLYGQYGLIVLIPDSPVLKSTSIEIFKDELLTQQSSKIVSKTAEQLSDKGYKAQAHGRDINLFYLIDDKRERIEKLGELWYVVNTGIKFNEVELTKELQTHPERFSPNVILRGIFQEMLLPNIIFLGGGGELAYWLELKDLFEHYKVFYPILLLRNSFLIIGKQQMDKIDKAGFTAKDFFNPVLKLKSKWVQKNSDNNLSVETSLSQTRNLYDLLSKQAADIDITLSNHIYALQKNAEKKITEAGKKMLRAEKRNYGDAMRQIEKLKSQLFPFNNLQERIDNIIPFYANYGKELIHLLLKQSYNFEQEFIILEEVAT